MKIEILYITGCPNHGPAVDLVEGVLEERGVEAAIEEICVTSVEHAKELAFVGSPSIRVNGMDIEPGAERSPSFSCRTYAEAGKLSGIPSKESVFRAIQRALSK